MNRLLDRTVGKYDLLSSDMFACYSFQFRDDAPNDLQRCFFVDIEKDGEFTGNALEVAREIQRVYESYSTHSDTKKIRKVIEYLEKWEKQDYYDGLIEEREQLKKRLETIEYELSSLQGV